MASSNNAAKKLDTAEPSAANEPSMDEILASIRDIIAEDEGHEDGLTERERYTHPDNPSNSNLSDAPGEKLPVSEAENVAAGTPAKSESVEEIGAIEPAGSSDFVLPDIAEENAIELPTASASPDESSTVAQVEIVQEAASASEATLAELEAGLEEQIAAAVKEEVNVADKVAAAVRRLETSAPSPAEQSPVEQKTTTPVTETITVPAEPPAKPIENVAVPDTHVTAATSVTSHGLHEKAEKVRSELGLSTAAGVGLTLEQRLERYRVRGKATSAAVAAEKAEQSETLKEAVQAAIVSAPVAPVAQVSSPSANDIAQALLDKQSGALSASMEEFMRPLVREWLSNNLPGLVERLVRSEIERVSQGRKAANS